MTNPEPLPIPHSGAKPDWLEDDVRVSGKSQDAIMWWKGKEYYLPADHWAYPALAAGLTPWNHLLQGDGPPKNWKPGRLVMFKNGYFDPVVSNPDWSLVIGYEPSPATPAEHVGYLETIEGFDIPADADDDTQCTDCEGTGVTIQTERRCSCQPTVAAEERSLEELIKTRLLGVSIDDQDLALEDDDWRAIITTLRQAKDAATELQSLRDKLRVLNLAIDAARDMVPDDCEGLAARIFTHHLNAAQNATSTTLATIRSADNG